MKVGIVGLGAMGRNMAENLCRTDQLNVVWNRTTSRSKEFALRNKIAVAKNLADLAQQCNVIITCVSADDDLKEVVNVMLPTMQKGTVVIDTSTVASGTAQALASLLTQHEVSFIDAPVSGGVEGAKKATLVMMVGGDKQALETVMPVLKSISSKISWMGDSGAGQATKAVNQIMAAGINQAVTEALSFAEAMQLPLEEVIDVISSGAAGNWFLQHRGKTMIQNKFEPGFKINLHKKDLDLCREMIEAISTTDKRLPIVEMTRLHYERLQEAGYGEEDISALYRLKKEMILG